MAEYGYVWVSMADQNEDRQLFAMSEDGVSMDRIFTDKQFGKDIENNLTLISTESWRNMQKMEM